MPDLSLAAVARLLERPDLRRAQTPHDAGILLVAGDIPGDAAEALGRVQDQVPRPRSTVTWTDQPDIADVLRDACQAVCSGERDEDDSSPDAPPNTWKGIGPHGQGGKEMMGGTPYGRPMAMKGPNLRDGLQVDRSTARLPSRCPAPC
ncbi:hypothetical protein ILP92_01825 [Maribius pontilimi]|uniref:Uncharacterized protein n=1 Tax=Palleronia pontilimi TaxID=1964209 RepID=A0A934MBG6_9RHOB|nr:hypothetical protein [Palleronia pontilimi]MBJ3761490.1 hypothetical protein [Palleronia pontilimi]